MATAMSHWLFRDLPTKKKGNPENNREICADILRNLEETKQVYIVGHDTVLSISKRLYNILDERRKTVARKKGIPEVQYEWEDFLFWGCKE